MTDMPTTPATTPDPMDMTIREYFAALEACPGRCKGCKWEGIGCDLVDATDGIENAYKRPLMAMAVRLMEEQLT